MPVAEKNFVVAVGTDFNPDPEEKVFDSLFKQYERVVVQSLITSFGLDLFIKDRHGGDVDTVHNVRQIGKDSQMQYKNAANETDYNNRGEYNSDEYHKDTAYIDNRRQNKQKQEAGTLEDAYTGKRLPRNANQDTDHVVSGKEIHEDRGRVLSGKKGNELGNSDENLKATDRSINRSKGERSTEEYIAYLERTQEQRDARISELKNKPKLTDKERKEMHKLEQQNAVDKEKMRDADQKARNKIDGEINKAYYTSPKFLKDAGFAAVSTGIKMGLRQALGLVLTEVWFSVKEALAIAGQGLKEKLEAIASGIKKGFFRAKDKYKDVLAKLKEGALSGILSSLTTTLCNIFFTTAKNFVRIIRQTWASLVEATKILIFNPDSLPFAERMKAALKILAAGASVVLGTMVQQAIHSALAQSLGAVPIIGDELLSIVSIFAGTLCSGFLTVSLLYFIDSDPFGGFITKAIDNTIAEYKRQAQLFRAYAAELQKLDIAKFEREAAMYYDLTLRLENAEDDRALNELLVQAAKQLGVPSPWGENRSLNVFMNDTNAVLRFEA